MKIIVKHNGIILDKFGYDNLEIEDINELSLHNIELIKSRVKFRDTDKWDFEYGIGGCNNDEYYKIKNIQFANNNSEIVVKVSKVNS